jgi:signal peptidase II
MRRYQLLIAAAVLLLDRVTKLLVMARLPEAHSISLVSGLFQLSHWENTGAAFSMFAESTSRWRTAGLIAFSLAAIAVVLILLHRTGPQLTPTTVALSLVLGGAAGNLWDRATKGTVTDFLDFYIGDHHWPPFNVADSAIVVGALLLMITVLLPPSSSSARREH